MAKPSTATPTTTPAKYALSAEHANSTNGAATALAAADKQFESILEATATAVARVLGLKPSYEHWEAVSDTFRSNYQTARGCNEETARKRWVAVSAFFSQDKPTKPTAAAAAKAGQRASASEEAAKLIAKAKAATPQDILAIATKSPEPLTRGVISALGRAATERAAEATKGAAEAAKLESKKLRDQCLTTLAKMTKLQLTLAAGALTAIAEGRTVSIRNEKPAKTTPAEAPAGAQS